MAFVKKYAFKINIYQSHNNTDSKSTYLLFDTPQDALSWLFDKIQTKDRLYTRQLRDNRYKYLESNFVDTQVIADVTRRRTTQKTIRYHTSLNIHDDSCNEYMNVGELLVVAVDESLGNVIEQDSHDKVLVLGVEATITAPSLIDSYRYHQQNQEISLFYNYNEQQSNSEFNNPKKLVHWILSTVGAEFNPDEKNFTFIPQGALDCELRFKLDKILLPRVLNLLKNIDAQGYMSKEINEADILVVTRDSINVSDLNLEEGSDDILRCVSVKQHSNPHRSFSGLNINDVVDSGGSYSSFPVSYEKLCSQYERLLPDNSYWKDDVISVLKDYVKPKSTRYIPTKRLGRFFSGHLKRHHIKAVNQFLENHDEGGEFLQDLLTLYQTIIYKTDKKGEQTVRKGSLARRLEFCLQKGFHDDDLSSLEGAPRQSNPLTI